MNEPSRTEPLYVAVPVAEAVYPAVLPAEDVPAVLPVDDYPTVLPVRPKRVEPPAASGFLYRLGQIWHFVGSYCEWIFGALALIVGLAVLAALPVVQFLSLGYLLEAGGRVARTGRLREGFIGVRIAARVASIVLGTWLVLLPLRLVSSLAISAEIVDPGGPAARGWRLLLSALTVAAVIHIVAACSRGGKLRYFFWPFNPIWLVRRLVRGGYYAEARDAVWNFVMSLRLPYYFWLGVRGFAGAFLWLAGPITLLALGRKVPALGFLGGLLLPVVLLYVPFLQMRFAATNRFASFFELGAVRRHFCRAPVAFAFALFVTLLFALPLYLLKIEMIPREAAWLPSLVFIVFIFPTRLLTGWAYGRAERRRTPRHWVFRWSARPAMLATAAVYVFFVYFTQFTSWDGVWSLYEQHAFLLPVPFAGMTK